MADEEPGSKTEGPEGRHIPVVARLLLAFVVVSILPIGVLAYLSTREAREPGAHAGEECPEPGRAPGEPQAEEGGDERACPEGKEAIGGVPIATIEMGVAGASLLLSVLMALYIGRTLVRPIEDLEGAMAQVESGDLQVKATPMRNDEIGHLAGAFNRMVEGLRREELVRDLFGQYVTPEVASIAIERRGHLDGELVFGTVLFADIRNFTGISEAMRPRELIEMLNHYFSIMSGVIVDEGGLVNKFGGDSLLAVFGTPLNPSPDHPACAVRAALRMRAALREFNKQQREKALPEIDIGVGIATGELVAGNVGSEKKVEYTVIGDTVNLASRLQSMTKELQRAVLVTAESAAGAPGQARYEPVGEIAVRGKSEPVRVFSVQPTEAA